MGDSSNTATVNRRFISIKYYFRDCRLMELVGETTEYRVRF